MLEAYITINLKGGGRRRRRNKDPPLPPTHNHTQPHHFTIYMHGCGLKYSFKCMCAIGHDQGTCQTIHINAMSNMDGRGEAIAPPFSIIPKRWRTINAKN